MRTPAAGILCALVAVTSAAADVLYVDDDAVPAGDGLTWATAMSDLQDAIDIAARGGVEEIRIAQGVYRPDRGTGSRVAAFALVSGVTMRGGFAGPAAPRPDDHDPVLYLTVLSGDLAGDDEPGFVNNEENSYGILAATNLAATAVLEGCEIRGGNADGQDGLGRGGALQTFNANPSVVDCRFVGNRATWGGAIHATASTVTFVGTHFEGNRALTSGGAINFESADLILDGCTFESNAVDQSTGGAIRLVDGVLDVTGGAFCNNSDPLDTNTGGAVHVEGVMTVSGCEFAGNTADAGGGIFVIGSLTVETCTFDGNGQDDLGSSAAIAVNGELTVTDSTFTGNRARTNGAIGVSGTTVITGSTFDQNAASFFSSSGQAGAIRATGPTEIADCIFTGNRAHRSGALSINSPTASLTGCTFENNEAQDGDAAAGLGALHDIVESVEVSDCTFTGNTAQTSVALTVVDGSTVTNCQFTDNEATQLYGYITRGGAWSNCTFVNNIGSTLVSPTSVVDCVFQGATDGPVVSVSAEVATIDRCVFLDNTNDANNLPGGALRITSGGECTVTDSLFAGNATVGGFQPSHGGMAVVNPACTLTMRGCTVYGNSANGIGGGIYVNNGAAFIDSCIVWGNTDSGALPIMEKQIAAVNGATLQIDHACVQWLDHDTPGTSRTDADPLFVDAVAGDLNLLPDSPCINTGSPALVPGDLDALGNARVQACRIDMGAVESPYETGLLDCDYDGVFDACDIADGIASDCNLNGRPDDCDIEREHAYDDGRAEPNLVLPGPASLVVGNRYHVEASDLLLRIAVAFVDDGVLQVGSPVSLFIWDDPDNDGLPDDAVELVRLDTTVQHLNDVTDDLPETVDVHDVPPTFVSGTFFIGAAVNGVSPVALDDSTPVPGGTWFAFGSDTTAFQAAQPWESFFVTFPGNLFLRGLDDCDGNDVPDACEIDDDPSRDINGNGVLDACEAGYCPADANRDGQVDVDDLVAVISGWGTGTPDLDGDGVVAVNDLVLVITAWGACD